MIKTGVKGLRDPFILLHEGVYYMYGTGTDTDGGWSDTEWACYVNDSGSLTGEWKKTDGLIYEIPKTAKKQFWAPEVHRYRGAFYLIASYFSEATGYRGSAILRSESPTGPFVEITDGHVTPRGTDCIDATLYVDEKGAPWLVFVDEWTSTPDGIGRMDAARLSDDLSRLITEPRELFRADDPVWSKSGVTDGCFMHRTASGDLLMLWSNFDDDGYCIALAHSTNGKIDGDWVQDRTTIVSRRNLGENDGGHGMLFSDTDGQGYICLHSPNSRKSGKVEEVILIPYDEMGDTVIPRL